MPSVFAENLSDDKIESARSEVLVILKEDGNPFQSTKPNDEILRNVFQKYGAPVEQKQPFALKFSKGVARASAIKAKFPQRANRSAISFSSQVAQRLRRHHRVRFLTKDEAEIQDIIDALKKSPLVESVSRNSIGNLFAPAPTAGSQQLMTETPELMTKTTADIVLGGMSLRFPNDPLYKTEGSWGQAYDDLWGLKKINAASAWMVTTGDADIVIAVIDSGLDFAHEDIKANVFYSSIFSEKSNNGPALKPSDLDQRIRNFSGYDFYNDDANPTDDHGHGTHVSGTIAAVGNNGIGITGVMWQAKILPLKVTSPMGYFTAADLAEAIIYAADEGADVINMSLGLEDNEVIQLAVEYAYSLGVALVAASGNDGEEMSTYPALYPEVIAVGASTENDSVSTFSNYGPKIDIVAPGGGDEDDSEASNILSLRADGTMLSESSSHSVASNYYRMCGTSMATPHVVGVVGLLLSHDPTYTQEEVRQLLRLGAKDIEETGWDEKSGYGRMDAYKAVTAKSACEAMITRPENGVPGEALETSDSKSVLTISANVGGRDMHSYQISVSAYDGGGLPESGEVHTLTAAGAVTETVNVSDFLWNEYVVTLQVSDDAGEVCGEDKRLITFGNADLVEGVPLPSRY